MRLPAEQTAPTVAAALAAGITVLDTARAYGENERVLAGVLGDRAGARIITKGGMGADWIPDGRAKAILADCEASLRALNGIPIDTYLVHAPDPRRPWRTTVRALARLLNDGMVRHVGVANVNRRQLDEALQLAPIAAVEVALSVLDDRALRGGVLGRCVEAGVVLIAHSPLGGPRRRAALARHPALNRIARAHGATAAEVALAWLLALAPNVVAIPGARRPEAVTSAVRAAELTLTDAERAEIGPARERAARRRAGREVVLVMGIPGAGKSRVAQGYVEDGFARLNRDERGGGLRQLADALETELACGARRVVLDNTYLTRASRSYVLEAASRHSAPVRCVWLDTPLAQAQVNLVERLLDQFGHLPTPEELRERARHSEGILMPTSQMRTFRELEPPDEDEGFAAVEVVPFAREPRAGRAATFVAAAAVEAVAQADPDAPHLVFDWRPGANAEVLTPLVERLRAAVAGPVEAAVCPHGGGPPSCWCRPPLPGLALAFAREHGVDPSRSILIGTGPAHRSLAAALGAGYVAVP